MARRNQRKGDHLATSDYSGCTEYASKLVQDYWHQYGLANEVLKRNLQEIASPLSDPYPVDIYRGPQYEPTTACTFELQPITIGNTNVPFPITAYTITYGLDQDLLAIPQMSVGCTWLVR